MCRSSDQNEFETVDEAYREVVRLRRELEFIAYDVRCHSLSIATETARIALTR